MVYCLHGSSLFSLTLISLMYYCCYTALTCQLKDSISNKLLLESSLPHIAYRIS